MSCRILRMLILAVVLASSAFFSTADEITTTTDPSQLQKEADLEFSKYNFIEGIKKYEEAIKLYEQLNNQKGQADALYKLSVTYIELGKYKEAQSALSEAQKLHETVQDMAAVGGDITKLAVIETYQGNYDQALELSNKALKIQQAAGNQNGIADALRNFANINIYQSNYKEASTYVQQALEISNAIDDKVGVARCYNLLGNIHWQQGNLDEAMEQYQKALPIAQSIPDQTFVGKILGNMGLIYVNQGDTALAKEYYLKSLKITRETKNRRSESINLYNLAQLYTKLGSYSEAYDSYQQTLNTAIELGDKGLEAVCYEGIGVLQKFFANYDVALEYLDKSFRIAREIGEKRAEAYALAAIGNVYQSQKEFTQSLDHFQKALRIYEAINEKGGTSKMLESIGFDHWMMGNNDEALKYYSKSLAILESTNQKDEMPESYRSIGLAYQSKRQFSDAEAAFSKSIEISKEVGTSDTLWQSLHSKGEVLRDSEKGEEALALMKESIQVIERMRSEVNVTEQRADYFEDKVNVYKDTIQMLVATKNDEEAFEYVQRSKARAFLDMLAEAKIDQEEILDQPIRERKKKIEKELESLQQKIRDENNKDNVSRAAIQEIEKKTNELESEYSNLVVEIRKKNPLYADVQYPEPLKLSNAQALVDQKSVLLEYSIGTSASSLFVITPDSLQVFDLPGKQKLEEQVQKFRDVLMKPDQTYEVTEQSYSNYVMLAQTLYSELIQPAESILKNKEQILIAPDGILNYLPFECLLPKGRQSGAIDFRKLPYLTRQFEINYVPSISVLATVLKNEQQKPEDSKELLAFADPQLVKSAGKNIGVGKVRSWVGTPAPLPFARTEVKRIAELYPKDSVTVLEGKDASEENLKQLDLREYRKVHFASHGVIDEEKPEFSALILSSDKKGEDGYLTMREVFDLKLNADLVVLSACKTGLGKEINGEGVSGLSRAFLCAGTPSVLVSLWDVYDRSTADFMASFYKNMEVKKMNKAAALREARLEMITSKKFSHPYYWAPFALIGSK